MGETASLALKRLLKERRIIRSRTSTQMVFKELKGSRSDLVTAKASHKSGDNKWATVQAYYSIFHAARALLYNKGFREGSHRGLLKALSELYPEDALSEILGAFEEAMNLREAADYGLVYSEQGAEEALEDATVFLAKSRAILRARSGGQTRMRVHGEDLLSYLEKSKTSRSRRTRKTRKRPVGTPRSKPIR